MSKGDFIRRAFFLGLPFRAASKPAAIKASAVLFLDNKFPEFFSQIDYLFSGGFLPPDTEVVSKYYKTSYRGIIEGAAKYGAKVHFYQGLTKIPKILAGAVVVYPYNGQANARLMLNRSCVHVFVGHGDSNKKASCNPFLRAYDHVLIAGELSRERLIDNGILRPTHTREHTICIGTTVIDERHAALYNFRAASEGGALGYFPTWEGGLEAENYCSIGEPSATALLINLCRKLGTNRLVLDPHPNLGRRREDLTVAFRSSVEKMLSEGLDVQVRWKENKTKALEPIADLLKQKRIRLCEGEIGLCYAGVDVSAAEGIISSRNIPSAVLWQDQAPLFPAKSYAQLRGVSLVPLSNPEHISKFISAVGSEEDEIAQRAFRHAMFCCDDADMETMSHRQRWDFLKRQYLFPNLANEAK
jgi:hypothetical protein